MESNTTTMPVIATCIASPRPMGAPSYVSAKAVKSATQLHQGTAVSFAGLVGGGRVMGTDVDDYLGTTTCDPPD